MHAAMHSSAGELHRAPRHPCITTRKDREFAMGNFEMELAKMVARKATLAISPDIYQHAGYKSFLRYRQVFTNV